MTAIKRGWVVLALLLVACTGARTEGLSSRASSSAPSARQAARASRAPKASPPRLFVGVESELGVLRASCRRDGCTPRRWRLRRYLEAVDSGVMLFAAGAKPDRASVEIKRRKGDVVRLASLKPGTTMAYSTALRPGRYLVTLSITRGAREWRWLYGLRVPA